MFRSLLGLLEAYLASLLPLSASPPDDQHCRRSINERSPHPAGETAVPVVSRFSVQRCYLCSWHLFCRDHAFNRARGTQQEYSSCLVTMELQPCCRLLSYCECRMPSTSRIRAEADCQLELTQQHGETGDEDRREVVSQTRINRDKQTHSQGERELRSKPVIGNIGGNRGRKWRAPCYSLSCARFQR